jgi:hypothetical protein
VINQRKYKAGVLIGDWERDPTGIFIPRTADPRSSLAAAALSGANVTYWGRVVGGGTVTKLGIQVGAQSGNICVAVYANSGFGINAIPGVRLATSGSVACPAIGYAEVALDVSVEVLSGQHWFALAADNVVATFYAPSGSIGITSLAKGFGMSKAAFPCPDPAAASSYRTNPVAIIGVA